MITAYTVEQIRAAESAALARTPNGALMRRAATAVATVALSRLSHPRPGRAVTLLVGSGNNGGDALYAGVLLARRGIGVTALLSSPERAHVAGLQAFRRAGGKTGEATDVRASQAIWGAELVIDGLVGIGATPPLRAPADHLVHLLGSAAGAVLAVDVPSGVNPDTGAEDGPAVRADVTVTFGAPTSGLLVSHRTGQLIVADLGLAPSADQVPDVLALEDADAERSRTRIGMADDKFSSGVVGVVAGSEQYPGAAVLSVGAAVSLRPGLVRYAGPQGPAVLARWPEVIAATSPAETGRVQAWVAGPGMGTDGAALARLHRVIVADVPVVIDADGLTLLSANPTLLSRRNHGAGSASTVLTPHSGEFARLWPDLDPDDRLRSARSAARRSGAVVLLKGHRTLIAAPDGRVAVNQSGTGWLATAGSGDVLTGMIGSLLAAGLEPFLAAAVGAHLHGRAGERAQRAGRAGAQALWSYLG
jgi:hydroxyethylthiazole kinase-like uncharacterized protein yjeF